MENTLFIGNTFLEYSQLTSTNTFALDYLTKNNPSEGTVISTPNQTSGRGQIGSKWESEADKNISLSIILYPKFLNASEQFYLSKVVGLAVRDFLETFLPKDNLYIKWPNDLYVNDKKIGGILIQNILMGVSIKSAVVGIGININQINFLSDAPNPTSVQLETGQTYDISALNRTLLWYVEKWYMTLKANRKELIDTYYLSNLYRINEWASYQNTKTEQVFQGKITGITKNGQLEMATSLGLKRFNIKEIKFRN
ncbi:MAG: biotin--[acetyl-CoA-carboxylase] ligase [Saprospiraceae bacterium]